MQIKLQKAYHTRDFTPNVAICTCRHKITSQPKPLSILLLVAKGLFYS